MYAISAGLLGISPLQSGKMLEVDGIRGWISQEPAATLAIVVVDHYGFRFAPPRF